MKRFWTIILMLALAGIVIGGIIALILFNKPHRNIQKAKADFTLNATELLHAFESNSDKANSAYFGKVILVTGEISSIAPSGETRSLILASENDFFGINCSFNVEENTKIDKLKTGNIIQVKGECKGYIDDVILVNCYLIEKDYK
jgi:hypothetical protein